MKPHSRRYIVFKIRMVDSMEMPQGAYDVEQAMLHINRQIK